MMMSSLRAKWEICGNQHWGGPLTTPETFLDTIKKHFLSVKHPRSLPLFTSLSHNCQYSAQPLRWPTKGLQNLPSILYSDILSFSKTRHDMTELLIDKSVEDWRHTAAPPSTQTSERDMLQVCLALTRLQDEVHVWNFFLFFCQVSIFPGGYEYLYICRR